MTRTHTSSHLHQTKAQAPECVPLQQLKQIHIQALKHEAQVLAEKEKVNHAHDVALVPWVAARVEQLQQADLHTCLWQGDTFM
jgi:2-C-methyl-D-erythritol 4-phosphate cytidylyltransferase